MHSMILTRQIRLLWTDAVVCCCCCCYFFFVVLLLYAAADAATCPDCGRTEVPYPLSTSPTCGDQSYKVACNSTTNGGRGQLSLSALSGSYPILSVTPSLQRLVVGSPAIAADTCATSDLGHGGLDLDPALPFNVTSSNTVLLLNCSSRLLLSPLNCSSSSPCAQFLAQSSSAAPCRRSANASGTPPLCCSFTAGGSSTAHKITIDTTGDCSAYVSVLGLNPAAPATSWNYGIELEWSAPLEPVCRSQSDCSPHSTCQQVHTAAGASSNSTSRCLCDQGFHWNITAGVCSDDALLCGNGLHCSKHSKAPLIAGVTIGIIVCIVVSCIAWVLHKRRRATKEAKERLSKERQQILSAGNAGRSAKLYTSQQMRRATHGFARDKLLGSGGFGDVYKGVLDDGTVVAVKIAKVGNIKGVEQVLNEVRILSQVNHRALVMLLGCCVESEQPLLVYEFVSNGTLLDHLRDEAARRRLDWRRRLRIALQTAQGLAYLHSAANPPIIHRDVKSSNILLDAAANAKVSDFGLSRLAHDDLSHISTCAQGTLGYLDPEYYRNYQLTAKSDVYSFGVVLLELVTSQRVIDFSRGQDYVNLVVYVASQEGPGALMHVIDPDLVSPPLPPAEPADAGFPSRVRASLADSILHVTSLALACLRDSRGDRPSMKEVAEDLQASLTSLEAALGGFLAAAPHEGFPVPAQAGGFQASPSDPASSSFSVESASFDSSVSSTFPPAPHVFFPR